MSRAYPLDNLIFQLLDDTARQNTTPDKICLPMQDSLGIPKHLYLSAEEARNQMLYIVRWLMTYNHVPSPIVLGWREDIDKEFPGMYSE